MPLNAGIFLAQKLNGRIYKVKAKEPNTSLCWLPSPLKKLRNIVLNQFDVFKLKNQTLDNTFDMEHIK